MKKRSSFGWLNLILGILLVGLGIYSFANTGKAITSMVVIYAIVVIISGALDILFYFKMRKHEGFGPTVSLVSGIIIVLAGVLLLLNPVVGKWIVTVAFPILFIGHGISRLSNAGFIRLFAGRGVYIISLLLNTLCIILGVALLFNPAASSATLGWLIALSLTVHGVVNIIEAFSDMGGTDVQWD